MWVAAMVGAAGVAPFMMGVLGAEKSKKIVRPIPEYDYLSALARFGAEEASKQDDFPAAQQILREEAILMKLLAEATKAMPSMRTSERLRKLVSLERQAAVERGTLSLAGRYFNSNANAHEKLAEWCREEEEREDPKAPSGTPIQDGRESGPTIDAKNQLHCTFCGKGQTEVSTLVAGPSVYICDECIVLCGEILEERAAKASKAPRPSDPPDPPPPPPRNERDPRSPEAPPPFGASAARLGDTVYYTLSLTDERRTAAEKQAGKRGIRAAMVVRVEGEAVRLRVFSEYGPYEGCVANAVYTREPGQIDNSWSWRESDLWREAAKR